MSEFDEMKLFLKQAGLFLALFLIPCGVVEALLRQPVMDSYAAKHYLLESHTEDTEVLILGSSLSWAGLISERIHPKAINVGNYEQSFYYDLQILRKYAPRMPHLKVVILPLSYGSCFTRPSARQEHLYSIYWDIEPYSGELSFDNYSALIAFGFWNSLKKIWRREERVSLANRGWGSIMEPYDGSREAARRRFEYLKGFMAANHYEEATGYVEEIVRYCRQRGIRPIVYLPPYAPQFNALLEGDPQWAQVSAFAERLEKKFGLEVYDFNDNERFPTQYFRDPDHLNIVGAEVLSHLMHLVVAENLSAAELKQVRYTAPSQ